MAKTMFCVVVIKKGQERDYFDLLKCGVKYTKSGEELTADALTITEVIEAKNKQDAVGLVQSKYPGFTIDSEATSRH